MDGQRFEALSRAMAGGGTRRRVLKLLGVGVGGGLLALRDGRAGAQSCGQNDCKAACTAEGFSGRECAPICGSGQFRGFCPVGQGGGNPCCNPGLCDSDNFERVNGVVTYTGPTAGC